MSATPYSEHNPVPSIKSYEKSQLQIGTDFEHLDPVTEDDDAPRYSNDRRYSDDDSETMADPTSPVQSTHDRAASAATNDSTEGLSEQKKEKKELMDRMARPKQKPTDEAKKNRGDRMVDDPVTGEKVMIRDAQFEDYPTDVARQRRGLPVNPLRLAQKGAGKIFGGRNHRANPTRPSNINLQPFPPAVSPSLKASLDYLLYAQIAIIGGCGLLWLTCAFGSGFFAFIWRSMLISGITFAASYGVNVAMRKVEREVERIRFDMHRQRGEKFANPTPESTEWLNAFISTVWGLVNPELFVPVADMVEDVMQQSLPAFVEAIRISDIGQGSNPFRIISMRALADKMEDSGPEGYPREEWIDQGTQELTISREKAIAENPSLDLDQAGDYVNLEVAFAYQAQPGQGDQLRSKNIHLLLEFFVGMADWLHIPIPIWAQVDGVVGTVRLRIQFIPEAPYVRNLTFTLMGVPAVDVSVTPMSKFLPNVLDLPLISTFVKMAIKAGTASLVAPKSMTLNLQEMMSGAVIGDTRALGVFVIKIKYGESLSAQDRNGQSDPYIVLAYAKFGKPLYSTRIILGDRNPVFEETAFLLVTQDEVKADEQLSAMLWDSDKHTADDLIGRVTVPIKDLMKNPNKMYERTDALVGFEDATSVEGKLHWDIGFFSKVPLNKELEKPLDPVPPPQKAPAAMEMRPGDKGPYPGAHNAPGPADVSRTPPEAKYPSGIFSIIIHQINNLEAPNLTGATGKDREGRAGQDTDEPAEQGDGQHLPSGYCEIVFNDDMIYKTRVKQYSSMPYFEAGTEVFVRNWQEAVVRVVVRDSRLREKDPILGIVSLKLTDVFREASEVTQLWSIQEGVGFGRVNMTLLFKAVDAGLPKNMLGWDTGTVEILRPIEVTIEEKHRSAFMLKDKAIIVTTTDSTEKIPPSVGESDDSRHVWSLDKVRLPVYSRYSSSLIFELGTKSTLPGIGKKPQAIGVYWLHNIPDDEEQEIRIPIIVGKDLRVLRQNAINDFTAKTHEYEVIGWLTTTIRVDRGLDTDHEKYAQSVARRHAYETYDHVEGQSLIAERNAHAYDDGVVSQDEKKALETAHKKQLHNRHRGVMQYRPYRTAVWMKEGIKNKLTPKKNSGKREPTVRSEA